MKVVLFCGGLGLRMRSRVSRVPKPMERIGGRPILWHLMRYYAHYGHREFLLCLGAGGDVIQRYFARGRGLVSAAPAPPSGGTTVRLKTREAGEWAISLVPTGSHASIGQRLKAVEHHLAGEEIFLANYTDGLSDLFLPEHIGRFRRSGAVAALVCVRPTSTFHSVTLGPDGLVEDIQYPGHRGPLVNGGFFVFRREIFAYIEPGEDLVGAPFRRLVARGLLLGYRHDGFWACMDTPRDKQILRKMDSEGSTPWKVWTREGRRALRAVTEPRVSACGYRTPRRT